MTKLKHFVYYMIKFHCQQDVLSVEQEIASKEFLKRWKIFDHSEEIEVRLPFCWSFTTFWNLPGGLCTGIIYLWVWGDVKQCHLSKSSISSPDMEILLLLATTAKMLTKGYSWSGFKHHNTVDFFAFFLRNTTITISVVDIWKTSDKAIILQSCILDVLPKHSNIMAGKGLIFFYECTTRCVYLSP